MEKPPPLSPKKSLKKWSVGELQAMRAASRFMIGLGALAIIISIWLLMLSLNLTPEQKISDAHKNDLRDGTILFLVAVAFVGVGWKLRSYLKRCEAQTGQTSKPFGWMP
jgi:hypothetical protein